MADLRTLLEEFAAALESGGSPDPKEWIGRVDEAQRQELAALIDSYLMTAPRRAWDPAAFEGSPAKAAVDRLYESLDGVSGTWPELLPQLRNRARIKRTDLVRRLAEGLGVGGGDAAVEKVAGYYNRMEHGLLPTEGVSGRVIGALAEIVGASAEAIAAAGAGSRPDAGETGSVAFARVSSLDEVQAAADGPAGMASSAESPGRDEIDELFTGG